MGKGGDLYCNNAQISKYANYTISLNKSEVRGIKRNSIFVSYSNLYLNDVISSGNKISRILFAEDQEERNKEESNENSFAKKYKKYIRRLEEANVAVQEEGLSQGVECSNCINVRFSNVSFDMLKGMSAVNINNQKGVTEVVLNFVNFTSCSSQTDGGALLMIGTILSQTINCSFISNSATSRGGAIYYENPTNSEKEAFKFMNVKFKKNSAGRGG